MSAYNIKYTDAISNAIDELDNLSCQIEMDIDLGVDCRIDNEDAVDLNMRIQAIINNLRSVIE